MFEARKARKLEEVRRDSDFYRRNFREAVYRHGVATERALERDPTRIGKIAVPPHNFVEPLREGERVETQEEFGYRLGTKRLLDKAAEHFAKHPGEYHEIAVQQAASEGVTIHVRGGK